MKAMRAVGRVLFVIVFVVVLLWLRVHIRGGLWYRPEGD